MKNLEIKLNEIDWDDDVSIKNFIMNNEGSFDAVNELGEIVLVEILKGESLKISALQTNGWKRTNIYTIDEDAPETSSIIREELYDK